MPLTGTQSRSLKPKGKPDEASDFQGLYVAVAPAQEIAVELQRS
jgi:hypothetical protein